MTNGRNTGGIWLRDWSAIASNRAARWTRHVTPALGGIARRAARPTLRLFGAGRKPGPAMATALPRQEPLVLRMKRPERQVGAPFLTVQSDVAIDVDEAPVAPPPPEAEPQQTAGPGSVSASTPHVLRKAERRGAVEEPPVQEEQPSVVGRISRAVQRVLRRPAPPSARPAPEPPGSVAGAEAPPQTPAPGADASTPQASAASTPGPTIARAAVPEAAEEETVAGEPRATLPELTLLRQPEPAAPSYFEEAANVESSATALQSSAAPDAGHGLLMSLRRVFRPQPMQPAEDEAPRESPVGSGAEQPSLAAAQPAADAGPPAPSIAREVAPRMDEPKATGVQAATEAEPVAEVGPSAARAPGPLPEEGASAGAPALQRSSSGGGQRQDGRLLFTLRRLVRPLAEREAEPGAERRTEAPAASAPLGVAPEPAPRIASPEPAALPGVPLASREERAQPALGASMEEGEPEEAATPAFRAMESPGMTLRRSRAAPDITEKTEATSFDEAQTPALLEAPAAPEVPPVSRAAESGGRLPRILRLWRRPERARQDDLNLTLARPAAPPAAAAAAPVQRSTYNVETGRTEVMEDGGEASQSEAGASVLPRATAVGEPAPAVLRRASRPSAAPAQTPARSVAPLVYRARQAAEGPSAGGFQALAPGSMTTLEVSPAAVAEIRRATARTDTTMIARADGEAAPPAAPGQAPGEAPAPEGAGPAATPVAQEGEEETQITLEMLARQVYDRLRARMLIDRERAGLGVGMVSR